MRFKKKKHNRLRVIKKQNLFIAAWVVYLIYSLIFDYSEFSYRISSGIIDKTIQIVVLSLVMVKAIWLDRYRDKRLLITIAVMALILVEYFTSGDSFIVPIAFVLTAEGVEIKKFVSWDMKCRIFVWIILFALSNVGLIDNYYWIGKNSYGWTHPNTCAGMMILIMIEYVYLSWDRMKLLQYIVIGCVTLFLYEFVAARTYIYTFIALMLWRLWIKSRFNKWRKGKRMIYIIVLPVCIFLSFLSVYLYREGNSFALKMDKITTGRLAFANSFLSNYKIRLFGQDIYTVGSRLSRQIGEKSQILDMAYIRMPLFYGLVFTAVFVGFYTYLVAKLYTQKKLPELMIVLYMIIIGFGSTTPVRFITNISVYFIWEVNIRRSVVKMRYES